MICLPLQSALGMNIIWNVNLLCIKLKRPNKIQHTLSRFLKPIVTGKVLMKNFRKIISGFSLVLICLFILDFCSGFSHPKSENLFFPSLYEDYCFRLAFDRDIKDEKIISFECYQDMWHATGRYVDIALFCYEDCVSKGILTYRMDIEQKSIAEIEALSQEYEGFFYFQKILKQEFYDKRKEPLTKARISHLHLPFNPKEPKFGLDVLWYS